MLGLQVPSLPRRAGALHRYQWQASSGARTRAYSRPSCQQGTAGGSSTIWAQPDRHRQQDGLRSPAAQLAGFGVGLAAAATLFLAGPDAAQAADAVKVGGCLLRNCQVELARCIGDVECLEDLVCLNLCNDAEDEVACQIKCGDKYSDSAIATFNACAVSEKKCVPQRVDEGLYPVPPDCALDTTFNPSEFQGRWYITAGLNPLFDTFDCQEHFFASPEPGRVYGKIRWRINKPDNDFIEREAMQRFEQDPQNVAILYNHDNPAELLHYSDDWYVIAYKPEEYVFIYYRGTNDAWKGYGGATVYTRAASLPEEYIPELAAAAERAGMRWEDFQVTDNSCPPHPPQRSLAQELKQDVEQVGRLAASGVQTLEEDLMSFGRGFTIVGEELETGLLMGVRKGEEALAAEVEEAGRLIRRFEMEASMGSWVNWIPLSVREVIMPVR